MQVGWRRVHRDASTEFPTEGWSCPVKIRFLSLNRKLHAIEKQSFVQVNESFPSEENCLVKRTFRLALRGPPYKHEVEKLMKNSFPLTAGDLDISVCKSISLAEQSTLSHISARSTFADEDCK